MAAVLHVKRREAWESNVILFFCTSFFSPVSFLTLTYVNFLPASITRLLRNRFLYLQVQWEILEKPYRSDLS